MTDLDMTDLEWGWVAGIIDGEGCIGIYPAASCRGRLVLRFQVGTTSSSTAYKLKELVGGCVGFTPAKGRYKDVYTWQVTQRPAGRLLEHLLPLLIEKGPQARIAIDFVTTLGLKGHPTDKRRVSEEVLLKREQMARVIKELKHGSFVVA